MKDQNLLQGLQCRHDPASHLRTILTSDLSVCFRDAGLLSVPQTDHVPPTTHTGALNVIPVAGMRSLISSHSSFTPQATELIFYISVIVRSLLSHLIAPCMAGVIIR